MRKIYVGYAVPNSTTLQEYTCLQGDASMCRQEFPAGKEASSASFALQNITGKDIHVVARAIVSLCKYSDDISGSDSLNVNGGMEEEDALYERFDDEL